MKYLFLLILPILIGGCSLATVSGGADPWSSGSYVGGSASGDEVDEGKFYEGDFCGRSTYGECNNDSGCMMGGCSGQICQSKNEEPVITTCEFRDCYNAAKYNLNCRCIESKCQWTE